MPGSRGACFALQLYVLLYTTHGSAYVCGDMRSVHGRAHRKVAPHEPNLRPKPRDDEHLVRLAVSTDPLSPALSRGAHLSYTDVTGYRRMRKSAHATRVTTHSHSHPTSRARTSALFPIPDARSRATSHAQTPRLIGVYDTPQLRGDLQVEGAVCRRKSFPVGVERYRPMTYSHTTAVRLRAREDSSELIEPPS